MSQAARPDCPPWPGDGFDPTSHADCSAAMYEAHAFLHGELPDADGEVIRSHLMACEACMEYYEVEEMITALLRRSAAAPPASRVLRVRVESLHVKLEPAA